MAFQKVIDLVTAYSFITPPAFIIIFLFGLFPIGYAFYMSLINWNVRKGAFVGLKIISKYLVPGLISFGYWGALPSFLLAFFCPEQNGESE